ncbi:acetylserotonin O-methyltransferase-like [Lampetra fluviatilis]
MALQQTTENPQASAEDDYPTYIQELANGYRKSKILFTACELGVFDLLEDTPDRAGMTVAALMAEMGRAGEQQQEQEGAGKGEAVSKDGLERLVDACVGLDLLRVSTHEGTVIYSNTKQASTYLTRSSPKSMHDVMIFNSHTLYPLFYTLPSAVREGKHQHKKAFGVQSEDIFEALYRTEEERMKFMRFFYSVWSNDGPYILNAFDLSSFKDVCDVGGGTGVLTQQFARMYPDARVTLFDLPDVLEVAQKHFLTSGSVKLHAGDFFKDKMPEGDLYILAQVVHDWKEEQCLTLLRNIHSSCRPGGGVLIIETLLREDRTGPITAQIHSVIMLMHTVGKERTATEYTELLTKAGFRDVRVAHTGKTFNAILARK